MPTRNVLHEPCWSWQTVHDRLRPAGIIRGRIMINSEMLWTGSTALRPANRDADLGWTEAPPSGRHAGLGDQAATTTARVSTPTAPAPAMIAANSASSSSY